MYERKHTTMFTRIGQFTVRRRRLVLVLTVVVVIVAGVLGGAVFDRLSSGGFADPDSESTRADDLLEDRFGAGAPNVVLLVTADDGDVDAPEVAAVGQQLTDELAAYPKADDVVSYWSLGSPPPLRSEDGSAAMVVGRLAGDQDDWQDAADGLADTFSGERGPVTVEVGGPVEIFNQIGETIESDLARAESVAVPITLILLIIVFGGVVAALLPVGVGMLAVLGAFFVLWLVTAVTDVSVFSINLVTAMGLGLAIDYSLFVVSRFREELHAGRSVDDAVVRTVETAGRTVAFSALTVAASLSALLIFPLFFLRSFAYAGIGVILVAMLASLVSLPALLAVLGPRVDRWRVFRHRETPAVGTGFWHRLATAVMRRPFVVTVAVVALLVGLGLPFLQAQFGSPDHRVLPEGNPAREVSEALRDDFVSDEADAFPVVALGAVDDADVEAYATELSALPGIARVDARTGRYADGTLLIGPDATTEQFRGDGATWFSLVPTVEPISEEGEALVQSVRDLDAPFDEVLVGGMGAQQIDVKDAIFGLVPWAGALDRGSHVHPAVRHVRVDPGAGEGPGPQHAEPDRHLRGHGLDLPGGPRCRPAGLHADRPDRHDDADPHVLHRLRAVDGLRGLPPLPHQGGVRPDRRQRARGGRRPGAHRPHRHRRRPAAGRHVPGLRHLGHHLHQAVRSWPRHGRGDGRHHRAGPAGPGVHEAGR